jgi:hypothetical protein
MSQFEVAICKNSDVCSSVKHVIFLGLTFVNGLTNAYDRNYWLLTTLQRMSSDIRWKFQSYRVIQITNMYASRTKYINESRTDNPWQPLHWLLLLLRGGNVQSVPCTATILWSIVLPHLNSNHPRFIHQNSLENTNRDTYETESNLTRNDREFCRRNISLHTPLGFFHMT